MRNNLKTPAAAAALVIGLLAAPALYAQGDAGGSQGGMMGQGGMMQGGQGRMMEQMGQMTGMMEEMHRMMAACNEMMAAHMQDSHGGHGQGEPERTPQHEGTPPLPDGQPAAPEDNRG